MTATTTRPSPAAGTPKPHRLAALPCGRRTKYLVLAFWIIVVVVCGPLAGKLKGAEKNDASAYLPASAESTQELNLQSKFTGKNLNPAVVVYARPAGITPADLRKAASDARGFAALPSVGGRVAGPVPSRDHRAIETVVGSSLGFKSNIQGFVGSLKSTASRGDPGLSVHVAGPAASAADEVKIFNGIDSTLLYATLGVVVVLLLLLTYRSPVLWLLPIASAGVALIAAQAVIYLLTRHGLTVNGQSGSILVALVLGASTDYALLLAARYREELRRHADRHHAMAVALRRAGPAIIASAATVITGMLCLLVAQSADISGLGPVAAIGIGVGLLAMITLLPALLVICGRWMFWPLRPRYGSAEPATRGVWARAGRGIARRPRMVWAVTALALAASSLGLMGFKVGTLTTAQSFRGHPESVAAEQVLARHFPGGSGEPVAVIGNARAVGPLQHALATTAGIAAVSNPVAKDGLVYLQGTLASKPDTPAAYATVARARAALHAVPGAGAKVGGGTAVNADVARYAARDRDLVIPLVLAVVLVILALLLRAVVAPVLLIATVVLSFGAALGLSALVFRHLFGFAGADTSMPLFAFVFLVALGIDYNIFLMTRVREEAKRSGTRQGAISALGATGGVITSAGAVLAGTFATLGTLPLTILTEIGVAVAIGVLLDTLVVRSVLVTALNLDLGHWMWWPSRLARPRRGKPAPKRSPRHAFDCHGLPGHWRGQDAHGVPGAVTIAPMTHQKIRRIPVSGISVQLIGGPTAVLEYAGLRLVTDPTFDQPRSYGSGPAILTKLAGPAIAPGQLGHVDAVLISHDQHPDNLDESGRAVALAAPRVFTTVAGARRLGRPATGLRAYQHTDVEQVRITAVPALHGPPETGLAIGPVTGFILESTGQPTVYISGDNASLDVVAGVAEQFPATEIAVLHTGAAKVPARGDVFLTLTAEHAVRAAALLGVKAVVPVHQDGWAHFTQNAEDVLRAFAAAGSSGSLIDLRPGGSASL